MQIISPRSENRCCIKCVRFPMCTTSGQPPPQHMQETARTWDTPLPVLGLVLIHPVLPTGYEPNEADEGRKCVCTQSLHASAEPACRTA